ncbi:MAG: SGNH/GDSL hydrolase family protein [Kiritimatiellia bacterium]
MQIEDGAIVLFQGDSITDAGRSRENLDDLGKGYAMMTASWIGALYPECNIKFLNRGISGNRAINLQNRWEKDCLELKPTWVSIMIGINDTWRAFDSNDPTSPEEYQVAYDAILADTQEKLDAQIVLIEPFVLPHPADRKAWRADLNPRIDIVRELAIKYDAILVPMDGIFAEACTRREPAYWAADGVHPSLAGHALIAQSWLQAVS